MRHALKFEKVLCVGKGQPSGDFEIWVPHPCAVRKGAVFLAVVQFEIPHPLRPV